MVTPVCLGTMTFGIQNTEEDAHDQLDYAIKERGVNFIDTAELYPVPTTVPEYDSGRTETYIGTWLSKNKDLRESLVIATKVCGYIPTSTQISEKRGAKECRLDADSIVTACEHSLERLQTPYIDLYQLHWPDRYVPLFGKDTYDAANERDAIPISESIKGIKKLLDSGKIKAYGLSNETTFGVCEWVRLADEAGIARPCSIQNSFSLLHRSFETELAEACAKRNFNIGLLPWSPLGGGMLSGKYLKGETGDAAAAAKGRLVLYKEFQLRFVSKLAEMATQRYAKLAESAGLSPTHLALAFCKSRSYVASTIIGATTLQQLKENIDAFEDSVSISADTLTAVDVVAREIRDPILTY